MDKVHAAVIGSGFGGLALAICLQAAGCRTVLFEMRDQAGGRAYVYRDNDFTFDELMGTTYGIPFGAYSYTSLFGVKWFDHVPLLIPLSWFTMSWACWVIARGRAEGWPAILLSAALLIAWDLLLDPAMSKVTSYWMWGEAGNYYGMPWMNLFGWGATGLVQFIILHKITPSPHSSQRFALAVYVVNFALPLGFCVLNQYWLAAVVGPLSFALAWLLFGNLWRGTDHPSARGFPAGGTLSSRRE